MDRDKEPSDSDRPVGLGSIIGWDIRILLILGAAGFIFSLVFFKDAFADASLNLKITKSEAVRIAGEFARQTGYRPGDTHQVFFSSDREASTFLQYELGNKAASQLMKHRVPVWKWNVYLRNKSNEKDFEAGIGTDGSLHSLRRHISDKLKLPSLSHEEARKEVEQFIKRTGFFIQGWKLVAESESKLPTWNEHLFVFEDQTTDFKGARLRISAKVAGNKLVAFDRYLKVPQEFTTKYKTLRAQNKALAAISWGFMLLGALCLPFVFIQALVKQQLRFRFALITGAAAALICLLSALNNASRVVVASNSVTILRWLAGELLGAVPHALLVGFVCAVFFGSIEALYRATFKEKVALENILNGSAIKSRGFFRASLIGLAFFGIDLGYQVSFYLIGKNFGFWVPLGISDTSVLNTFAPVWDGISIGIKAATTEELGFRVFFLIILMRATRSFWLANFVQAAIWGFAHCTYMIEPPYARGLELTIAGLYFGWVMRRYGLVPVLLSHYAFDAYLSVLDLFGSPNIFDRLSALLPMAPLVVLPILSFRALKRTTALSDESLNNSSIVIAAPEAPLSTTEVERPKYLPLSQRTVVFLSYAFLILFLISLIPEPGLGRRPLIRVSAEKAIEIARDYYRKEGFEIPKNSAAWLNDDTDVEAMSYVRRAAGFQKARRLAENLEPRLVWIVKFLTPEDPEMLSMKLAADGSICSPKLTLNDNTKGAQLTTDEARVIALDFLKQKSVAKQRELRIVETLKEERAERTDYRFTVEIDELKVKAARYQMMVWTVGKFVSNYNQTWRLPQWWHDQRSEGNTRKKLIDFARLLAGGLLLINLGYWALHQFRENTVNWYPAILLASVFGALKLTADGNYYLRHFFAHYNSSEELTTFLIDILTRCASGLCLTVALYGLAGVVLSTAWARFLPRTSFKSFCASIATMLRCRSLWADAIIIGYTTAAALIAIQLLENSALCLFTQDAHFIALDKVIGLGTFSPLVAAVQMSLGKGLVMAVVVSLLFAWKKHYEVDETALAFIAISFAALVYGHETDTMTLIISVAFLFAKLLVAYAIVVRVGRSNPLAAFLAAFVLSLAESGRAMLASYRLINPADTYIVLGLLILPLFWLAYFFVGTMRRQADSPEPEPKQDLTM